MIIEVTYICVVIEYHKGNTLLALILEWVLCGVEMGGRFLKLDLGKLWVEIGPSKLDY